jgi:lipid-A-disaccharide synthase
MDGGPIVWLAAAEGSADALGAGLARELTRRLPDVQLRGIAGPRMRAAGVAAVVRSEDVTTFGLVEAVPRAARVAWAFTRAFRAIRRDAPAVLVTIDSPDLLLALARAARRGGVPAVHWVSPQVWAWRAGRVGRIAASTDTLLCLLPFEPALYAGRVRAVFVGHPAAAIVPARTPPRGSPRIALCPGSRITEVERLWPVLREVARRVRIRWPESELLVPVAPTVGRAHLPGLDATFVDDVAALAGADGAVTASGTATLELAALGVPQVVVYRVHPATAAVARVVVRSPYVALPNVLAGRPLVPEHLQDLDPEQIFGDLCRVVGTREQVPRAIVDSLRGPESFGLVADEVMAWLTAPRG